jgi:excisionase family DNA binding protein
MDEFELLTVEEVAKEVKVHAETVRAWIRSGELVAVDIGGKYRVTRGDLHKFIEKRKTDRPKTDKK